MQTMLVTKRPIGVGLAFVFVLLSTSCERSPSIDQAQAGDTTSTRGPAPSISAAPTVGTPAGSDIPSEVSDAKGPQPLPPVDRSCRTDNDCVLTSLIARGEESCCESCNEMPVAGSWKAKAQSICEANAAIEPHRCQPTSCKVPEAAHAECISGTCEWVRGEGGGGVPTMRIPSDSR